MAGIPNPLILFDNHFARARRYYSLETQIAVAEDLCYDGYEMHEIAPDDDTEWEHARRVLGDSRMQQVGMYLVAKGITDEDLSEMPAEIERVRATVQRLATLEQPAYLILGISGSPNAKSGAFHESGSTFAEERHWDRAAQIANAVDDALDEYGVAGYLYPHVWFMIDTIVAQFKLLERTSFKVFKPGLNSFHNHFHEGTPEIPELFQMPRIDELGYLALLNALPKPEPFRTVPLEAGQVDIAQLLGHVWTHDYRGPIILQAYDLGGDPYYTAERAITYVKSIWDRFQRNPRLNPAYQS